MNTTSPNPSQRLGRDGLKLAAAGLLAVLLVACYSTGSESIRLETEESVAQKLIPNETTKAEVRALYGAPLETNYTDGGLEIWKYEFFVSENEIRNGLITVATLGAVIRESGDAKELTILFDENDVVWRYNMSESEVELRGGLIK